MTRRNAVTLFVVGSALTFAVVWWLLKKGHPLAAFGVLEASPFPCPPGVPC